jgi:hypothetical protein
MPDRYSDADNEPTYMADQVAEPEAPAKVEEPAPGQPASKFLPEQPSGYDPAYYSPEKIAERASKFLPPAASETPAPVDASQRAPEPAPTQPASKFLPEKETLQPAPTAEKPAGIDLTLYAPKAPAPVPPKIHEPVPLARAPEAAGDDWTRRALKEEFKGLTPPAPEPAPKPKRPREDREIYDLRQATWKQQVQEYQEFADGNGREYKQHAVDVDTANRWKMENFDQGQRSALVELLNQMHPEPRKGFRGILEALHRTLNPQDDDAIASAKQEDIDLFKGNQARERREYIKVLEENKRIELAKLRETHLAQQAERERGYNEEIERRIAEFKEAKRLKAELEADERQLQKGPEREDAAPTTKRREPLPSDPWMAQIGGTEKLSPDHLASAQRSYDAWPLNKKYDFGNYVSYVQRQWERIELPPAPEAVASQPPKPAYDPAAYAPKAYAPKAAHWTEEELTSKFNALVADPEIERRLAEFKEAQRIAKDLEARQREKELKREGPQPPEEGKG